VYDIVIVSHLTLKTALTDSAIAVVYLQKNTKKKRGSGNFLFYYKIVL
jgi:hypothetical protein